jgi:hypothetical protein
MLLHLYNYFEITTCNEKAFVDSGSLEDPKREWVDAIQKLTVIHFVQKILSLYETKMSLPSLQEFAIGPFQEPDEPSLYPHTLFL